MGFLAALPWIIKGGAALGGALLGKKAQSAAMKRSPEEQQALQGANTAAGALSQQGQTLTQTGLPAVQGATNYWQTLLRGDRASMAQATAGPRAALTDQYRGAERGLERSGIRGGAHDLASAELQRDRASKIAGLTTGVQPAAAQQLGELGSTTVGQGTAALQGVGSIYSSLLGQGYQNRVYGRQEGEKFGGSMGSLIFDILSGTLGKKKAGGPLTDLGMPGQSSGIPGTGGYSPPQLGF